MSSQDKQVGLHGARVYLTPDDVLVAKSGFASGGEQSQGNLGGSIVLPGSPKHVAVFDDFLGDVVADQWNYAEGDTGNNAGLINGTSGVYRMTLSTSAAFAPASVASLNGGVLLQWKRNVGKLRMAARVKASSYAGVNIFVGLTDTGAAEMPYYDTGATAGPISTATNAVGWIYGSDGDAVWTGVGVNAGTDATSVAGAAPTTNVYDVLELAWNDTGDVYFYQNGVLKGSMSAAVAGTRWLTPAVAAFAKDTGGQSIDIDYINVSANRDTGI